MEYRTIDNDNIGILAEIFTDSFNDRPWNVEWTNDTAKIRLEQMLSGSAAYGFAAYENGEPCGLAIGCFEQYYDGIVFNLREFCVKNTLRGKGVGAVIYSELERKLKEKGVKEITLNTLRGRATEGFYEKLGMTRSESIVVMTKKI